VSCNDPRVKDSSTQEAKNGAMRNAAQDRWFFLSP
jgi:hypothetical protein